MRAMPLLECTGTVVVHRDDSVTCTTDTCPRDLPVETRFSLHTSFVTCGNAFDTDDCPHCGFDASTQLGHGDGNSTSSAVIRSRSRARDFESARRRRPSSWGVRVWLWDSLVLHRGEASER
jgi:hypothetical protein